DTVLRMLEALTAAEAKLRYALSKRVFLEISIVQAIKAREMVGIDGVLKRLNELKAHLAGGFCSATMQPAAEAPATTAPPDATATAKTVSTKGAAEEISHQALQEAWSHALEHLGKVMPLAQAQLKGAKLLGLKDGVLTVGFSPECATQKEYVDMPRNHDLLQARLKEKLHAEIKLRFVVTEAASPLPAQPQRAETVSLDDLRNDPLIQKALETFKATILEVRR
ncbi:MAG: hypothetical protein N3B01_08970, partial [Verrucomicrobiae bacterium]|nr:hypothetical protein [Verrucomicrobiae bacterium]